VPGGNGAFPYSALVQGSDGKLYGTTSDGGSNNNGVVFDITMKGSYTVLYHLSSGGADGGHVYAGLLQATDGNYYGAANDQGNGYGTFFRITSKGKFTVCEDFNATKGRNALVTPIQHTNGTLYGDTANGGAIHDSGVFYALNLGLKSFVSLLPTPGEVGAKIGILGQGFKGTTAVSFNGTAAKFTVVSSTYMTAVVPAGATTGFVTATTPKGTLKSNKKFRVKTLD
jgi:uncharacterized repeat protein (TIGR03803 family)